MKLLKIKDNSQYKKDSFSEIAGLTGKIADKTLEQLEREGVFIFPEYIDDAEDITRDQMILQSVNDSYRSSNVMGFIGCGSERLIIESRFSGEADDYFFQYLLEKTLDVPNIVDLESDANQDYRLFNLLLFLFPYYLKTAMRKGLFKKYIRHDYNDGNVKETIDIARHIEKNIPFSLKNKLPPCRIWFRQDGILSEYAEAPLYQRFFVKRSADFSQSQHS